MAAGAGRRFGGPKALAVTDGVPWVCSTLDRMRVAGCDPLLVVTGAAADRVVELLPDDVQAVPNPAWESGMASSLRAGLEAAGALGLDAVLVMLVDLPGVTAAMLTTLLATGGTRDALVQADFDGTPGHPVLLGAAHWPGISASITGDDGARRYLQAHRARVLPLGTSDQGADRDTPG